MLIYWYLEQSKCIKIQLQEFSPIVLHVSQLLYVHLTICFSNLLVKVIQTSRFLIPLTSKHINLSNSQFLNFKAQILSFLTYMDKRMQQVFLEITQKYLILKLLFFFLSHRYKILLNRFLNLFVIEVY